MSSKKRFQVGRTTKFFGNIFCYFQKAKFIMRYHIKFGKVECIAGAHIDKGRAVNNGEMGNVFMALFVGTALFSCFPLVLLNEIMRIVCLAKSVVRRVLRHKFFLLDPFPEERGIKRQ